MARVRVASTAWGYVVKKSSGRPWGGRLHTINTTVYAGATGATEVNPADYKSDSNGLLPGYVEPGGYEQTDPDGDVIEVVAYSGEGGGGPARVDSVGALGATETLTIAGDPEVWLIGTLDANLTLTIPDLGEGETARLFLTQDATGDWTVTVTDGVTPQSAEVSPVALETTEIVVYGL